VCVCVWKLEHKTDNIAHKDIEWTTGLQCDALFDKRKPKLDRTQDRTGPRDKGQGDKG